MQTEGKRGLWRHPSDSAVVASRMGSSMSSASCCRWELELLLAPSGPPTLPPGRVPPLRLPCTAAKPSRTKSSAAGMFGGPAPLTGRMLPFTAFRLRQSERRQSRAAGPAGTMLPAAGALLTVPLGDVGTTGSRVGHGERAIQADVWLPIAVTAAACTFWTRPRDVQGSRFVS